MATNLLSMFAQNWWDFHRKNVFLLKLYRLVWRYWRPNNHSRIALRESKWRISTSSQLFGKYLQHYEVNCSFSWDHLISITLHSRVKTHPILRIVMKELLKASNIPSQCPIKKVCSFNKKNHSSPRNINHRESTSWKIFQSTMTCCRRSFRSVISCVKCVLLVQLTVKKLQWLKWQFSWILTMQKSAKTSNYSKKIRFFWKTPAAKKAAKLNIGKRHNSFIKIIF